MGDCLDLDRVAPSRRPEGPNVGTQKWRELLFVHWSFEPELVRPLVPDAFELDLWQGRAWVGLVPLRMQEIRLALMPKRTGLDFLETNLRTYVVRRGPHGPEPGIFFFSLEADSWLAVRAARFTWGLPYRQAKMHTERRGDRILYRSTRTEGERHPRLDVTYDIGESMGPSPAGTLEHFLVERYLLFCERRGRPLKGQVHHSPYPVRRASLVSLEDELVAAAGLPDGKLETVHYSEGVDVEMFGPFDASPPA